MNLKELRELIELVKGMEIAELEIERSGFRVKIKRSLPVYSLPAQPIEILRPDQNTSPQGEEGNNRVTFEGNRPETAGLVTITSPIVGTFYRAPAPDADFYVDIGDTVKKGQVLCVVEAMKLMNEIESELEGKIVEILVESSHTVEFGQPLFRIQPN